MFTYQEIHSTSSANNQKCLFIDNNTSFISNRYHPRLRESTHMINCIADFSHNDTYAPCMWTIYHLTDYTIEASTEINVTDPGQHLFTNKILDARICQSCHTESNRIKQASCETWFQLSEHRFRCTSLEIVNLCINPRARSKLITVLIIYHETSDHDAFYFKVNVTLTPPLFLSPLMGCHSLYRLSQWGDGASL